MATRRQFIKEAAGAAAGVLFTGCDLLGPAYAQPAAQRRQVTVGGRRVKVIDVHCHCVIPEAMKLMNQSLQGDTKGQLDQVIVVEKRLRSMDEQGIDIEALSINPTWYGIKDRDLVSQVIKVQCEKLAELCGKYPDRFVAYTPLGLQFPDLAVQQLEEGIKKYGLRGAAIGGSVAGEEFANPKFDPVWRKAEEMGELLFIHPQSTPELAKRFQGNGWLANAIGNPLDTTIALSHLIFEGTLDKFPGLKVCAAHGGGYLPSYAARSDHSCFVTLKYCDPNIKLKKKPTEYLKQMYYDALVFTPEMLRHLIAEVGSSQIVLGTDHPIPWDEHTVDHILNTPSLSDAERIAIFQDTAAKLLKITV
jgi:predicted TIM-barrel fold metal-dependent hydrolase